MRCSVIDDWGTQGTVLCVDTIDRYNFDKNKEFLGIPDAWNGRFVELGWAKFFTSVGIMGGTKTWRK